MERICFDGEACPRNCTGHCEREAIPVNTTQVGGLHYKTLNPQPWDVIHAWRLGFIEGCVVKYVARWRAKNGVEDLRKARHYLDKLIELNSQM